MHVRRPARAQASIPSTQVFGQQIRQGSRSAHERKLRGLYVDYSDGAVRLPREITEQETWQLIGGAQAMLDLSRASWAWRVEQADWFAAQTESFRAIWMIFLVGRMH